MAVTSWLEFHSLTDANWTHKARRYYRGLLGTVSYDGMTAQLSKLPIVQHLHCHSPCWAVGRTYVYFHHKRKNVPIKIENFKEVVICSKMFVKRYLYCAQFSCKMHNMFKYKDYSNYAWEFCSYYSISICINFQDNLGKPVPEDKPFWDLLKQEMMEWR